MTDVPTCGACGRLMRVASGCALTRLDDRPRVPYGYEDLPAATASAACQDCAVVSGQFHHWGCRVARCGECGGREHAGPCPEG